MTLTRIAEYLSEADNRLIGIRDSNLRYKLEVIVLEESRSICNMVALIGAPRIAILEADVLMPELRAKHGRYGDMFTRLLNAGAMAASLPTPQITSWDIVDHPETYPNPSEYDAILVTGSRSFQHMING